MLAVARAALGLLLVSLTVAPFQCASEPETSKAREETPGEALYGLAEEFGKAGDKEGQKRTLKYIVERYPRSKFAEQARTELKEMGVDVDAEIGARAAASTSASAAPSASASSSHGW